MKKIKLTLASVSVLLLVFTLVVGGESPPAKSKSSTFEMTSDVLYPAGEKSQSTNFTLRVSVGTRLSVVCAQPGIKKIASGEGDATAHDSEASESRPQRFSLSQNYPNPFNPRTSIRYALPQDAEVGLTIYNILGQKVTTLVDEHQAAGFRTVWWDGKDAIGDEVSSGVYFYRLTAGEFSEVKKMLLVK